MHRRLSLLHAMVTVFLMAGLAHVAARTSQPAPQAQSALGSAFTYQGRLMDGSGPASGAYTLTFRLFSHETQDLPVGSEITRTVTVTNGLFTTQLDFGAQAFAGEPRWLEIAVGETTLQPRQPITPAPYALFASSVPWSGIDQMPVGFADGVDHNTTYSAGSGLSLNGTRFEVAALPLGGFSDRKVVSSGDVGTYSSIIIGVDGLPLISYYDAGDGDLEVFHCSDMQCAAGTQTTLDSAAIVGKYTSITIGRDGFGLISYYDDSNGDLKLAHCKNVECTAADITPVDRVGNVGQYTSITTNRDGFAFISYYDVTNGDLKVASCSTSTCSNKSSWTVDNGGDVGQYSSVTRTGNGDAYISYYDATNGNLEVARCSNMLCSSPTISTVDGTNIVNSVEEDVGRHTSITTGADGFPLIVYAKVAQPGASSTQVRVAHCTNGTCSTAETSPAITLLSGDVRSTSITLGQDGLGLFSATFSSFSRVYVFHCSNVACSARTISDDVVTSSAIEATLTMGADGLPILSYANSNGDDLHVVHCSDFTCQPYLRRR